MVVALILKRMFAAVNVPRIQTRHMVGVGRLAVVGYETLVGRGRLNAVAVLAIRVTC